MPTRFVMMTPSPPPEQHLTVPPETASPDSLLQRFLHLFRPTPDTILLLLALLIGLGAGAGVVLFRFLIHIISRFMYGEVSGYLSIWGHWTLALIPVLGGAVIGVLRWQVKDFGPGLSALMEMLKGGHELLPLKPISKMVAAAVSLGSGASLGPEGPSVEIGANFSLLLGQVLKVSQARQKVLLGAGAAAGLAAGFNAPIAGVFFALEVVLGTTSVASSATVVLLASVIAAWIAQIGLGAKPAFDLPAYEVRSLLELPLYIGLGVFASLISILFKKTISVLQDCFHGKVAGLRWLAAIPQPLHPLVGGVGVGLVALKFPQVMGVGYETVESILQDVQFPLGLVLALLVLKLLMTAWSFGSGFVGGFFAPAMFLGASLGSSYGKVLAIALPMLRPYMATPPAYAMVGMAAVLAGSVRAPMTAILLLFELTQDYRIVLPLMAAVGLSAWMVERLQPMQLDSDGEQQKIGVTLPFEGADQLRVIDALQPIPLQLPASMTLETAGEQLLLHRCHAALVMDEAGYLVGILTLQDVNRLLVRAKDEATAALLLQQPLHALCTKDVLLAYPDEPLPAAIARMTTRGLYQLPVLERGSQRVLGLLTQEGISLASSLARAREMLHRPEPPLEPLVSAVSLGAEGRSPENFSAEPEAIVTDVITPLMPTSPPKAS